MDRPIYIFTGFLDSGKTTSIRNVLLNPGFTEKETTLIVCFEEGDVEYDEEFLTFTKSSVVYEDFENFNEKRLLELDDIYNPDRIIIEFNGMDDDRKLLNMKLPRGWQFVQMICLIDASKFKLYVTNMSQFMFNHVSMTQIVVLNRYEGCDFKYLRANIKTMNQYAVINLEDENHIVSEFPRDSLFDKDNLNISDMDFGLFYMDVVENFQKYKDKKVSFNAFCLDKVGKAYTFGRYAMVCCSNDLQRFAMKVYGIKEEPVMNSYYNIEGYIRLKQEDKGYRLYIENEKICEIDKPEQEYVSFS